MNRKRAPEGPGKLGSSGLSDAGADAARLRVIVDAIPQMVWTAGPNGRHEYSNQRWRAFTGIAGTGPEREDWTARVHPDDEFRARQHWRDCLHTGKPLDANLRLRDHAGNYHWVAARALPTRDQSGAIEKWFGSFTDIGEFKARQDRLELLASELSHRIKNVYAVVSSIIGLAARERPEAASLADTLQGRIGALARAHDYATPQDAPTGSGAHGQSLLELIKALTIAYNNHDETRFTITGSDVEVGSQAASALALVLHELGTNAAKHGALSVQDGRVEISLTRTAGDVLIRWRERGGPPVPGAPQKLGFGALMAQRVATSQLDAEISTCWRRDGITVAIKAPAERLAR
jgi:PAS domain S-box-containing protein